MELINIQKNSNGSLAGNDSLAGQIFRLAWALPAFAQIPEYRGLQRHCVLTTKWASQGGRKFPTWPPNHPTHLSRAHQYSGEGVFRGVACNQELGEDLSCLLVFPQLTANRDSYRRAGRLSAIISTENLFIEESKHITQFLKAEKNIFR